MTTVTLIKFCDTAPISITNPFTLQHIPVVAEKNSGGGWLIKLEDPLLISDCIKNYNYFLVDPPEFTGARVPNNCTGVERKRFDYKAVTKYELEAGRKMEPLEIYQARDAEKSGEAPEQDEQEAQDQLVEGQVPTKKTWSRRPKNKEA